MHSDTELNAWRRAWQAPPAAAPIDLAARVARETRMMRRFLVGEVLITITIGGGSAAWALVSGRADVLVLAIGVWLFTAIAWTTSWLLRRGAWAPVDSTTTAFLELSILRCQRRRESVIAQCVLYVMILTFDLIWIYFEFADHQPVTPLAFLTSPSLYWVWAITIALACAAVWQRQRLGRELVNLTALRRKLADEGRRAPSVD